MMGSVLLRMQDGKVMETGTIGHFLGLIYRELMVQWFWLVNLLLILMEGVQPLFGEYEIAYFGQSKKQMVTYLIIGCASTILVGTYVGMLSDLIGGCGVGLWWQITVVMVSSSGCEVMKGQVVLVVVSSSGACDEEWWSCFEDFMFNFLVVVKDGDDKSFWPLAGEGQPVNMDNASIIATFLADLRHEVRELWLIFNVRISSLSLALFTIRLSTNAQGYRAMSHYHASSLVGSNNRIFTRRTGTGFDRDNNFKNLKRNESSWGTSF
ncbi:hypothetical protein Tco_0245737 [Tanacetum coccineum]